jgi:inorganic triphosphatase YgiF
MTSELELKFQVPEGMVPSLRLELQRHGARSTRMVAHYFDTVDELLARHGLSLRLRREGRQWVQTLKAEGDSAVRRFEHSVPVRVPSGSQPRLELSRHDGTEAGAALHKALADAGTPDLVERFVTDVSRRACELQPPGAVIEAAFDQGTIRVGDRSAPICELELEHKFGDSRALFALAKAWRAHGGLWLNTLSKARRGALLASEQAHGPAVKAGVPALSRHMDGAQMLRAMMRSALDHVLANASELASGSLDEEHVHQVRVGLRRLRTALREVGPLGQGVKPEWDEALSETFARLGEVRDNETVARAVRPLLEQAGAPKLDWQAPAVKVDPGAVVRDATFQSPLIELLAFALHEEARGRPAAPHAEGLAHVRTRLSKLHRQVVQGGKRFEALPREEQHRVRKRLKRLRYLSEFVEPLWKGKDARRYLRHLGPAQDALGAHNDVAVAMQNFRKDAEQDPRALFAAGYLQAHLDTTARAAHTALKRVADAFRFWKR